MLLNKNQIKKPRKLSEMLKRYGCELLPTITKQMTVVVLPKYRGQRPDAEIISEAMVEAEQEGFIGR